MNRRQEIDTAPRRHAAMARWVTTLASVLIGVGAAVASVLPVQAADDTSSADSTETTAGADSSARTTGDSLQKVGEARLQVLLWSVYTSRLYTPTGRYTESERPLRLEIEYLIDVKSSSLVDRTASEWEAMGRDHPRTEDWLERLNNLWPDIDKKDVLTLEVDEDDVSTFFHNGDRLGQIEDPAFGEQFLDIWLSEDSTRPALRKDLIGMVIAR